MKILEVFAAIFLVIALIDAKRRQSGSNRQSRNSRLGRSGTSKTEDTSDSQVRTAILLGTVFGASSWKSRSNYKDKGELPQICYNDKYDMNNLDDAYVSYEGRFVCPTDDTMGDGESICCGQEGQQYCCNFWEKIKSYGVGPIVGIVIGIIAFVALVFVLTFCLIKNSKALRCLIKMNDAVSE